MHPNVTRVVEAAAAEGLAIEVRRFPEGTRTAADAARAVGCEVAQIVKSLVFMVDDRPVVALVSGANRVDLDKLASAAGGTSARRADGDEARAATGFAIGGVPPFGHATGTTILIDRDLEVARGRVGGRGPAGRRVRAAAGRPRPREWWHRRRPRRALGRLTVPSPLLFGLVALLGIGALAASSLALRMAGAQPAFARRLAGPREVRVGLLLDAADLPDRPVRVAGRIRCRDPLQTADGERLVAFHRDVEVMAGGSWRSVERLRETRSFELWDHDGSLTVDPAAAAEPLVVIPKVWRGDPALLEEPHASTVARLVERHGAATVARSVVRTLDVTDRLLVVARPSQGTTAASAWSRHRAGS